ncbi:MAG: HD domain-containing protein [Alcaligenaceae bacterium]|nr:HD domain-containing protein [Alcaligenaceae bacterium]
MALTLNDVTQLLTVEGNNQYGGEAVSQLEHALQCAALAEQAGETPHTITAALLHDIGHLLAKTGRVQASASNGSGDDLHQYVALPFLRGLFSNAVLEPIRLHVDAKRYLCATDQSYWTTLSTASKHSLIMQGGTYTPPQAAEFEAQSFAQEAVRLRRYDDLAKMPEAVTPALPYFLKIIHSVAL